MKVGRHDTCGTVWSSLGARFRQRDWSDPRCRTVGAGRKVATSNALALPAGRRRLFGGLLIALALFALIQAVPYGRSHSNPAVTLEPKWDSPQTRALAVRACFDCHSNQTKWRWYSNVAPASWLVQSDVDGGRHTLNFSEWDRRQEAELDEIAESIRGGSMPPWFYVLLHSNAKLSKAEKERLIKGLEATFANSPPQGGGG